MKNEPNKICIRCMRPRAGIEKKIRCSFQRVFQENPNLIPKYKEFWLTSSLPLKEKKVRKFMKEFSSTSELKKDENSYYFQI